MNGILGGGINDINLDNYYTKEEADDKFETKTSLDNYYTKEEADDKYLQKTGGTMSGVLNIQKDIADYICFVDNTGSTKGSITNDNGNLRMYGENGNLVLQSDNDVVLTASGGIRLENANVSIGTTQNNCDLTVDGQTNLNGDLMVNANMTVSNNAQFDDTVIIDGTTAINNDCNVNGCFTLNGDLNITNSGALDVTGSSTFHYDVTCNDILTVDSTLYTFDFVATGVVEFKTNSIIIGTSGNTITINKAFFDSILDRLTALENKTSSL